MTRRVRVSSTMLPGFTAEGIETVGSEVRREAIFEREEYVGDIVWVERGEDQGWRPAAWPGVALSDKVNAVTRLFRPLDMMPGVN